jgi:hypothetical protein
MAERPLTVLQRAALLGYTELTVPGYGVTHAELALHMGLTGPRRSRGPWAGRQNPGQRLIPVVIGLERRGLVKLGSRRDGLSGTAYGLTPAGEEKVRELLRGEA